PKKFPKNPEIIVDKVIFPELFAQANILTQIALRIPVFSINPPTPKANKINTITSNIKTIPPRFSNSSINSTPEAISPPEQSTLNASKKGTPWKRAAQIVPRKAPNKLTDIDGIFMASNAITMTAGINIYQLILKNSSRAAIVASACVTSPLLSIKKRPVTRNNVPARMNAGALTYNMDLICSIKLTFESEAVITVVSDKGDNLSPT